MQRSQHSYNETYSITDPTLTPWDILGISYESGEFMFALHFHSPKWVFRQLQKTIFRLWESRYGWSSGFGNQEAPMKCLWVKVEKKWRYWIFAVSLGWQVPVHECVFTREPLLGSGRSSWCWGGGGRISQTLKGQMGADRSHGARPQPWGQHATGFQDNVHVGTVLFRDYVSRAISFLKHSSTGDSFYFVIIKPIGTPTHWGLK